MHKAALNWIVGLLHEQRIPFLICGGLAAIGYGSKRELNDIDLFVPGDRFLEVEDAGEKYVSKPARRYREQGWDLEYVQFKYQGIKIEVGNADGANVYDAKNQRWAGLSIDFSRSQIKSVFDIALPLMTKDDLIRYKAILARQVDLQDIEAIR